MAPTTTPPQFSSQFEYFPFSDAEWAARGGYLRARGKKQRSQLGEGAFAITYRMEARRGMEAIGIQASIPGFVPGKA